MGSGVRRVVRPLPYSAVRKFVEVEGWAPKGTARGAKKQGHHECYTLALADGTFLATRISHGTGQYEDPTWLLTFCATRPLQVSEAGFWACVEPRGEAPVPKEQVPRSRMTSCAILSRNSAWCLLASGV